MTYTYYSNCKDINKGPDLQCNMEEWPTSFQDTGMIAFFQELPGMSLKESLLPSVDKKGK